MHILHKMNAHWRHDSLLHWRTWIEDKLNAFSKNKCVSEFTSQLFCSFFPVYIRIIICSPPLSLRPFQVKEKEHFCVKYLNVLKINCYLLLNIITTKISSERTSAIIMKKLCLSMANWTQVNPNHMKTN